MSRGGQDAALVKLSVSLKTNVKNVLTLDSYLWQIGADLSQ